MAKKRTIINHKTPGIARGVPVRAVTTSGASRTGLKRTARTAPLKRGRTK